MHETPKGKGGSHPKGNPASDLEPDQEASAMIPRASGILQLIYTALCHKSSTPDRPSRKERARQVKLGPEGA